MIYTVTDSTSGRVVVTSEIISVFMISSEFSTVFAENPVRSSIVSSPILFSAHPDNMNKDEINTHSTLYFRIMIYLGQAFAIFIIWGLYPLIKIDYNPHTIKCQGGIIMITFEKLWETMTEKGISTYQLREKCGIDSKTIRRLKANENVETKTLDKLCYVLSCKLEDIAEYHEDTPE